MRPMFVTMASAIALLATPALAQSPAGNPSEPSTIENQQSGPSPQRPSDPAAADNPSARVPTAPTGANSDTLPNDAAVPSGDGAGSGETGYSSPAGNPSDPTTDENQQPGPSVANPTDPAAGSKPSARVPTAPK